MSFVEDAAERPGLTPTLREACQDVATAPDDDDLGLRGLLERPEAFSHPWWRDQARKSAPRLRRGVARSLHFDTSKCLATTARRESRYDRRS